MKKILVVCAAVGFVQFREPRSARADEPKNYFSFKYGQSHSNMQYTNDAKFKTDNGTTKTVEFFWGNSPLAKWIGGVNLSPTNKYAGFLLGIMIDDQDIVTVKQFNTEDELLKGEGDLGYSRGQSFGLIKATTTEYTWIFKRQGSEFLGVTYGTSNFPAKIYVSEERTPEDEKSFFDPRPEFQYLHIGFELDPIRAALLNSKSVNSYALDWIVFQCKFGLGVYHFELSDTQYSWLYENPNDMYGIKRESGFDIISAMNFELGVHGTIVQHRFCKIAPLHDAVI